jgi:hypothetical protein
MSHKIDKTPWNQRKVLSIDVGVKNLAFCLMSLKDNTPATPGEDNIIIHKWESINLIDEEYPQCKALMKSGKKQGELCNKTSRIKTDENEYFCSSHNPDKIKYKCQVDTKVKAVLLKDKCVALYRALDKCPELISQPVEIVIEKQMKINPTMLAMSHLVYSYFIMKGYCVEESPIKNVHFINAYNKLTVYNGPEIVCHLKTEYSKRKWLACRYTEYMLRNDKLHRDYFEQFPKKKDDLSDCYLQGVWWLTKKTNDVFMPYKRTNKKTRKKIKISSSKQSKQKYKYV